METGTMNERIRIYEPKSDGNQTSLDEYDVSAKLKM